MKAYLNVKIGDYKLKWLEMAHLVAVEETDNPTFCIHFYAELSTVDIIMIRMLLEVFIL